MKGNLEAPASYPKLRAGRLLLLVAVAALLLWTAAQSGPLEVPISRVSVTSDGAQANGASIFPALNADGRFVAFESEALNLVLPPPEQSQVDIFVHDRETSETERVSVSVEGFAANGNSFPPALSGDGVLVAFGSAASNLLGPNGDRNQVADVFLHNRSEGSIRRISVTSDGAEAAGGVREVPPSISVDGRFIAFETTAILTSADPHTGLIEDAYVFDRDTGNVELASRRTITMDPEPAFAPAISGNGCLVAFVSASQNLLPQGQDPDEKLDVYVTDRCADPRRVERVSLPHLGTRQNADSQASLFPPSVNEDGTLIVFESDSNRLVEGDGNNATDIFVRDRLSQRTERASVTSAGEEANGVSLSPSISDDGRYVVFASLATNFLDELPETDTNGRSDVFVHDRSTNLTCRVSLGTAFNQANGDSVRPVISRDGQWIAFESTASNLVPGDTNGRRDIFLVPNQTDSQECPPTPVVPTPTPVPRVDFVLSRIPAPFPPGPVATGQLGDDDNVDLALAGSSDAALALLRGDGNGGFAAAADITLAIGGDGFGDAVAADVNGDKHLDIVASIPSADQIVAVLGDGQHGLAEGPATSVGATPGRLRVRELTGDGVPDVVVATQGGVAILRGGGDGGFEPLQTVDTGAPVTDVVIFDANGDRALDVVAAVPSQDRVQVIPGDGTGRFTAGFSLPGPAPLALATGDFNGDGRPDLAVGNAGDQTISVFTGPLSGVGQQPITTLAIVGTRLVKTDIDADGLADLLALDEPGGLLYILFGTGNGRFDEGPVIAIDDQATGFAVADLNHDRLPDVVFGALASQEIVIGINNAPVQVLPGDTNGDGRVDEIDLRLLIAELFDGDGVCADSCGGGTNACNASSDVNGDGAISASDVPGLMSRLTL